MRIKSIVITLLSSIFLLSWTTEAFAAQEIVEVNAYDIESSTGGGSTQNFSFYNENPPNQPYTCGAALFTYFFNANILVEKINAPVFAMPALFDCPNSTGAILSTEIESCSTYR